MKDYLNCFKKYAVFKGRASRKEFWMFTLFNIIILAILSPIGGLFSSPLVNRTGILNIFYSLIILIPTLSVTVRRLHDTNRSGWWLLINLIPFIGFIVMFVFTLMDSHSGENKYGPNPKA